MRPELFGLSGKVKPPFDLTVKGCWVSQIRDSEAGRYDIGYVTLLLFSGNRKLLFNNITSKLNLLTLRVVVLFRVQITVTPHLLTFFAFCRLLIVYMLKAEFGLSKHCTYLKIKFCLTVGSSQ